MKSTSIDEKTAFLAMVKFLERYWERGGGEEIAALLGSLALQSDGRPADPALWRDWLTSLDYVATGRDL